MKFIDTLPLLVLLISAFSFGQELPTDFMDQKSQNSDVFITQKTTKVFGNKEDHNVWSVYGTGQVGNRRGNVFRIFAKDAGFYVRDMEFIGSWFSNKLYFVPSYIAPNTTEEFLIEHYINTPPPPYIDGYVEGTFSRTANGSTIQKTEFIKVGESWRTMYYDDFFDIHVRNFDLIELSNGYSDFEVGGRYDFYWNDTQFTGTYFSSEIEIIPLEPDPRGPGVHDGPFGTTIQIDFHGDPNASVYLRPGTTIRAVTPDFFFYDPNGVSETSSSETDKTIRGSEQILSISPNPVKNRFTVKSKKAMQRLELLNQYETLQYIELSESGILEKNLDMDRFTTGIYFLKAQFTDGSVGIQKIIKE